MRKIDAVLLSALILYDYSAQSLVDNDTINFGQSFITSRFHDNKLTDPGFEFTPEFNNDAAVAVRGVKRLNATSEATDKKESTISYHELANLNPETASATAGTAVHIEAGNIAATVTANAPEVTISIPDAAALSEMDAPETMTYSQASVTLDESSFSAATGMVALKINEHVAREADMSTFDSDDDGVYDIEDKCPGVTGVARFEGCPVPDSDADGVNDEEDRCPFEKGSSDSYGCPAVTTPQQAAPSATATQPEEKAVNAQYAFTIRFQPGSTILSTDDFNIVLQLTDVLGQKQGAKVEIEGNTNKNSNGTEIGVEKLVRYFRELGVKDSQLIIKDNAMEKSGSTENNEIHLRLTI
jgi:hypothetical protein